MFEEEKPIVEEPVEEDPVEEPDTEEPIEEPHHEKEELGPVENLIPEIPAKKKPWWQFW